MRYALALLVFLVGCASAESVDSSTPDDSGTPAATDQSVVGEKIKIIRRLEPHEPSIRGKTLTMYRGDEFLGRYLIEEETPRPEAHEKESFPARRLADNYILAHRYGNREFHLMQPGLCFFVNATQDGVSAYYHERLRTRAPAAWQEVFAFTSPPPSPKEVLVPQGLVDLVVQLADLEWYSDAEDPGASRTIERCEASRSAMAILRSEGLFSDPDRNRSQGE